MGLHVGDEIWIPCEVKPGPFSDERMVLISGETPWVGFINVSSLRDSFKEGETFVCAVITDVGPDSFTARLPGHSMVGHIFQGPNDRVTAGGPG